MGETWTESETRIAMLWELYAGQNRQNQNQKQGRSQYQKMQRQMPMRKQKQKHTQPPTVEQDHGQALESRQATERGATERRRHVCAPSCSQSYGMESKQASRQGHHPFAPCPRVHIASGAGGCCGSAAGMPGNGREPARACRRRGKERAWHNDIEMIETSLLANLFEAGKEKEGIAGSCTLTSR